MNAIKILQAISTSGATAINISQDESREFISKLTESLVLFDKVTVLQNIKGNELVPIMSITPSLKAKTCGYTDDQTLAMSDVAISTKLLGADLTLCENILSKTTWERYVEPGSYGSEEGMLKEAIINYLVRAYGSAVQDMLLTGVNGTHSIDGLVTQAYAATGILEVTGTAPSVNDAMDKLFAIYAKMPAKTLTLSAKPIIIVGSDWVQKAVVQSYNDNRATYNVSVDENNGFTLPTTNVRVQGFEALNGTNKALAGAGINMLIGTDLSDESTYVKGWWSVDNLEYRTSFRMRVGAALAFVTDMVKYTVQ